VRSLRVAAMLLHAALPVKSAARVEGAMAHGASVAAGSGSTDGDTDQWPT
jgi:hypothetical protein